MSESSSSIYSNLNKSLNDKVIEVFKQSKSNICSINVKIYSSKDSTISVKPMMLHTFNVIQNFEKEYMEKVTMTVDINIEEALLLVNNTTDLRATVTIQRVTQHYYRVIDELDPIVKEFKVIIPNPTDLRKTLQKVETMVAKDESGKEKWTPEAIRSLRYQLPMELVSDERYEQREKPTTCILEKCDVTTAVHLFANSVGIKKIEMTKSDNTQVYNNIFIPPMQTMGTFLECLQKTYGVYNKGLGYFIDEEISSLRVYPQYETDPESDEVHFYRLPKKSYPGNSSYNAEMEGAQHIILIGEMSLQNMSELGTELDGNAIITKRTDTTMDVDSVQKGKEAEIKEDNLLNVAADKENVAHTDRAALRYEGKSNNAQQLASELASSRFLAVQFEWDMSLPWIVTPQQKVVYHYEEDGGLKTTNGIISGMEHAIAPIGGIMTSELYYAWKTLVLARLSAATDDEEKVTADTLPTYGKSQQSTQ